MCTEVRLQIMRCQWQNISGTISIYRKAQSPLGIQIQMEGKPLIGAMDLAYWFLHYSKFLFSGIMYCTYRSIYRSHFCSSFIHTICVTGRDQRFSSVTCDQRNDTQEVLGSGCGKGGSSCQLTVKSSLISQVSAKF